MTASPFLALLNAPCPLAPSPFVFIVPVSQFRYDGTLGWSA